MAVGRDRENMSAVNIDVACPDDWVFTSSDV